MARRQGRKPAEACLSQVASVRTINECVEMFHVFSTHCETHEALDNAFLRHRTAILTATRLRGRPGEDSPHADILLINNDWVLEQSQSTHHAYWSYLPEMRLAFHDGVMVEPKEGAGLATYVVWASRTGRNGLAVAKDVHSSPEAAFVEDKSGTGGLGISYGASGRLASCCRSGYTPRGEASAHPEASTCR